MPYCKSSLQSTITDKQYYNSLQGKHSDFISYAKASTNYIPVGRILLGIQQERKTDVDYKRSAETLPNNEYIFGLTYSQSDYATSSNSVFYDILKHGMNQ